MASVSNQNEQKKLMRDLQHLAKIEKKEKKTDYKKIHKNKKKGKKIDYKIQVNEKNKLIVTLLKNKSYWETECQRKQTEIDSLKKELAIIKR